MLVCLGRWVVSVVSIVCNLFCAIWDLRLGRCLLLITLECYELKHVMYSDATERPIVNH